MDDATAGSHVITWMGRVLGDLAEIGYDAEWHCIPASAVGAPHRRDRIWITAYPERSDLRDESRRRNGTGGTGASLARDDGPQESLADTDGPRLERWLRRYLQECTGERIAGESDTPWLAATWIAEPAILRVVNGLPNRSHRLRALGNAVVPPLVEMIGRAIMAADQ
jgi:DNA (cytosine-5)-methyltransferase 1